jgi:hypothetical protein
MAWVAMRDSFKEKKIKWGVLKLYNIGKTKIEMKKIRN